MEIGVEFLKTVIADQTILIKLYEAQIGKLNEQIQALTPKPETKKDKK